MFYNTNMDLGHLLNFIYEFAYFLGVFALFSVFAFFQGRQAIMNVIVGLYFALLISIEFPNYDWLLGSVHTSQSIALAKLAFFAFITLLTTALTYRIMPGEFRESRFESWVPKLLLSLAATVVVMNFSFHVLPVTEFLTPGTPLQSLFGPEVYFFWWLLVPLVILYIV